MPTQTEPLFDVVIYEIATGKIESIAGTGLKRDTGRYNAERRYDTVSDRLNDRFSPAIVPSGKYKKGDTMREDEI